MGITLRIETRDPERPLSVDAAVWPLLKNWYQDFCNNFGKCPTITDLIETYIEILSELKQEDIIEHYSDEQIREKIEAVGVFSLEEMAYDEAVFEIYGTVGNLEEMICDLHICAGFSFEIDSVTEGFVMDLDMASSSALTGKKYLGPQIPLFRFLETSGDAFVQPGFVFSVAEYIKGKRRRSFS